MTDAPANAGYLVRACSSADREEQPRLFNACFKKGADARELGWRYDDGPHGASITLVTRDSKGRAVSGYACNPRRVRSRGAHETLVGETGDVMTHPSARGAGLFSELDRAAMRATQEAGWTGVFGLPNRRSAPLFVGKLGWNEIGRIRPHTHLLGGGARARALRAREGRLAGLAAPFCAHKCNAARRRLERLGAGVEVAEATSFPSEVGAISDDVAQDFDWMVRRDAPYLDWRFQRNPSGLHRTLLARRRGAMEGYAVVQLPRPDEESGFLVDLLAPDPVVRAALVAGAIARIAEAGAVAVQATAIDGSWWQEQLRAAGFLPPKPENHLIVISYIHDAKHPVARAMLDARGWYLSDGDRDDATMG